MELAFWAEMNDLADTGQHTSTFRSLDVLSEMPKEAKKRSCNPVYNIRNGKRQKRKELAKYFGHVVAKTKGL